MIHRNANYCKNFSFDSKICYPAKNTWGDCSQCDMFECNVNPCPKCGSNNIQNYYSFDCDIERFECIDCGVRTLNYRTLPAALSAWNNGNVAPIDMFKNNENAYYVI